MLQKPPKNLLLFLCLWLLFVLVDEAGIFYLKLNQLLFHNLSEQLTFEQLERYFENRARWGWLKYVFLPLSLWIKTHLIALVLALGGFFYEIHLTHKHYWQIVLQAEGVFLFAAVAKIVWFLFVDPHFTLDEVQNFVPFSVQHLLDHSMFPKWALYPLQLFNAFELFYWGLLAVQLNRKVQQKKGWTIVLSSYVPALLVWMIFIMFLTLNIS